MHTAINIPMSRRDILLIYILNNKDAFDRLTSRNVHKRPQDTDLVKLGQPLIYNEPEFRQA